MSVCECGRDHSNERVFPNWEDVATSEGVNAMSTINEGVTNVSTEINNGFVPAEAVLRATNADLSARVDVLGAKLSVAEKAHRDLAERVVEALRWAVEDRKSVTRYTASDILERAGLEIPTTTETFTVEVTGSRQLQVEVEPDEDDLTDQIDEAIQEEVGHEWSVLDQYIQIPTVDVSVDISRAVRTIEVEVELPWGAERDHPEFTDAMDDAISEEIGSDWAVEEYKILS